MPLIDPRQISQFSLLSSSVPLIIGPRLRASAVGTLVSVPLSSDGVAFADFLIPVGSDSDCLFLESLTALIVGADASGQLSLLGIQTALFRGQAAGTISYVPSLTPFYSTPPVLSLPKVAAAPYMLLPMQAPTANPVLLSELGAAPATNPLSFHLGVQAEMRNADGAAAHSFNIDLWAYYRIISGAEP